MIIVSGQELRKALLTEYIIYSVNVMLTFLLEKYFENQKE